MAFGRGRYILMEALVAAVLAPLVFALLRRGQAYLEEIRGTAKTQDGIIGRYQ